MIHRAHWLQVVNANDARWASNVAQLLLHNKQSDRPDALIIDDDNLVEDASAGIIASGMRVGQDLDVVPTATTRTRRRRFYQFGF